MQWGTYAGLITAVCTAITALGGMIVTLKVMIPNFRVNKDTHKIVNQQRTDMMRFQTVLINELRAHDIDIPQDQSKLDNE